MRKLIYSMMTSLDGFIETTDRQLDWVIIDEELHSFANDQARDEGAFLYGRRLYEVMAAHWPTADSNPEAAAVEVDFARIWRDKPKVVFSTTLPSVDWNSRLVRDDVIGEVSRLKEEPGGELSVGGAGLAAGLLRAGLVDEIRPIIHPVVLGSGTRFLPPLQERMEMRLLETRRFRSGVLYLRYEVSGR